MPAPGGRPEKEPDTGTAGMGIRKTLGGGGHGRAAGEHSVHGGKAGAGPEKRSPVAYQRRTGL